MLDTILGATSVLQIWRNMTYYFILIILLFKVSTVAHSSKYLRNVPVYER